MVDQESSAARSELPPLRLVHLLLYTAVCSVYLSFATLPRIKEWTGSTLPAPGYHERVRVQFMLEGLVTSTTITVSILVIVWWMRGRRVWDQPGHWIAASVLWGAIGHECCHQMVMLFKWLTGSESNEDFIKFWDWAKGFYALESLPFAVIFLLLALGWRAAANTWPWRLYFFLSTAWQFFMSTMRWLPFDWSKWFVGLHATSPYRMFVSHGQTWILCLLAVALVNDLLPGRPRRHWSHWVPAVHQLLIRALSNALTFVWGLLYSAK
jgi:hypothetical protein